MSNLEAESIFGEVSVLCGVPQPSTIRVCELCKVLRIDKENFFSIMEIYFTDGRRVLDNLLKVSLFPIYACTLIYTLVHK